MSREIKFRAWDKKAKAYVGDRQLGFSLYEIALSPFEHADKLKELEFEQDTGLKDKSGKEIYEGDIVTLIGEWEEVEKDDCNVVTFRDGCFRVGDGYEDEAGSYLSDWRVIGNIHENPELIGGEDDN